LDWSRQGDFASAAVFFAAGRLPADEISKYSIEREKAAGRRFQDQDYKQDADAFT
jgi:hypothetical protein